MEIDLYKERADAPEKPPADLTPKRALFCVNYTSTEFFGNGVQSYIDAYKIDTDADPKLYGYARHRAAILLKEKSVLDYINQLLDSAGLNDEFVDKQLLFLITQNCDLGTKLKAIQEFNKLRQRLQDKRDAISNRDKIQDALTILKGSVRKRETNSEEEGAATSE